MSSYDAWKLQTPEDEHDRRRHRRRDTEHCWNCGADWNDVDGRCALCGVELDGPDPDDARDAAMDR